jgi:myo-inositol-1(or 4)-monophosphatase
MEHSEYATFITATIRQAGAMAKEAFGHVAVAYKVSDVPFDVLTETDTAIDTYIKSEIRARFPEHAIHSEEGDEEKSSAYMWTIDPIDGSSNFSRGIPHFAVCIGLLEEGVPVCGAVYNPMTDELFLFEQGKGAFLNGTLLRVSEPQHLAGGTVLFTIGSRTENWAWGLGLYEQFLHAECRVRNMASSALDVCYLAAGRVDAVVYGGVGLLDITPAVGILHEAGGAAYLFETGEIAPYTKMPQRIVAAGSIALAKTVRELI